MLDGHCLISVEQGSSCWIVGANESRTAKAGEARKRF